MVRFEKRDPKTKAEVVNRILSYDFDGDIRHLGQGDARLERTGDQSFRLHFQSGRCFEFVVRIPRDAQRAGEERSFAPAEGSPEAEAPRQELKPRGKAAQKPKFVRRSQRGGARA